MQGFRLVLQRQSIVDVMPTTVEGINMIGNHIQSTDEHKPTTTNAKQSIVNVMSMTIDATRMIGNVIRMLDDIQQSLFILVNPITKASSSICRY